MENFGRANGMVFHSQDLLGAVSSLKIRPDLEKLEPNVGGNLFPISFEEFGRGGSLLFIYIS